MHNDVAHSGGDKIKILLHSDGDATCFNFHNATNNIDSQHETQYYSSTSLAGASVQLSPKAFVISVKTMHIIEFHSYTQIIGT